MLSKAEKAYVEALKTMLNNSLYDRREYLAYERARETLTKELQRQGKGPFAIAEALRELAGLPPVVPTTKIYSH